MLVLMYCVTVLCEIFVLIIDGLVRKLQQLYVVVVTSNN